MCFTYDQFVTMCVVRCLLRIFFFFFKQKTAYELRISDWSSDVCSSDLPDWTQRIGEAWNETLVNSRRESAGMIWIDEGSLEISNADSPNQSVTVQVVPGRYEVLFTVAHRGRSEEHTSEIQSLMRISYAVFCLKKNNID